MFPPIPTWDGMHPLVVHFPIALLLIAPVFVVIGLARRTNRTWPMAALLLMAIGVIGAFVATSTGEAADEAAQIGGAAEAVLERHEELAELARNLFIGLTLAFAAIVAAPRLLRQHWTSPAALVVQAAFLLAYIAAAVVLANAAHEGGRLVHEFGIHAPQPLAGQPPAHSGDDD